MSVISGIFLFTSRDMGYLGNLIKGIFSSLLKRIWGTLLFTSRDIGYWYPPPYTFLTKPPCKENRGYSDHTESTESKDSLRVEQPPSKLRSALCDVVVLP